MMINFTQLQSHSSLLPGFLNQFIPYLAISGMMIMRMRMFMR